ncbi:MAG: hypothetical protein KDA84_12950, partial [Planctomycetaceae bacterium]|nr:hypothetical protein [Planctomycetaceae bacterium]
NLTTRIMVREGFRGGVVALNDRFFDPTNDLGEEFSVFQAAIGKDQKLGRVQLKAGQWYDLRFEWDLSEGHCLLHINNRLAARLPLRSPTLNGLSYVRFRSTANDVDEAGFLVDNVEVSIADPYAPPCQIADQLRHEQRYTNQIVPLWNRGLTP